MAALSVLCWLASPAMAAGLSTDIELLRPTFGTGAMPGVDSPMTGPDGTFRLGLLTQYERDPLILYRDGREDGVVISHRNAWNAGLSWDFKERFSARLSFPVYFQWGSEILEYAADGGGLGDFTAGGTWRFLELGPVFLGARADVGLPIGKRDAWMGESQVRGNLGFSTHAFLGPVEALFDLTATLRRPVDTQLDFVLGQELTAAPGLRYPVWKDRLALDGYLLYRGGFANFFQPGAENPLEVLGGLIIRPASAIQVDLGFGKGLTSGYGTSEFRMLAALTWIREPAPESTGPEPRITLREAPVTPELVFEEEPPLEPPEEPEWEEEELARLTPTRIEIRDPIQFEFATDVILEESKPTLLAVAGILNSNALIGHVVIEGHASEEGSFTYNYDLSNLRSRAIYRFLVESGVHPDRLSHRGMGEVVPVAAGEDEAALARNRRVIFDIIEQFQPGDELPVYQTSILLPWTGDPVIVVQPPPPVLPEPEPTEPQQVAPERDELDYLEFLEEEPEDEEQP